MFRSVAGVISGDFGCELCDHTGWDVGREMVDGVETFYTMIFMGNKYTYVKRCQCRDAA
jgi:hypothetical protein